MFVSLYVLQGSFVSQIHSPEELEEVLANSGGDGGSAVVLMCKVLPGCKLVLRYAFIRSELFWPSGARMSALQDVFKEVPTPGQHI